MRKVNKNFSVLALRKRQIEYENDLLANKESKQSYWSNIKKACIGELLALYHSKCAYCETRISVSEHTIEHYRPKAKAKYYWLAHEWTNLLPCCPDCQDDKKAKGSKFETENPPNYAPPLLADGSLDYEKCCLDSDYLLTEKPLILNPEIDDPSEYFGFAPNEGKLLAKNENPKAKATIRIVNLNRDNLCFKRKKIVDEIFEKIEIQYEVFQEENLPDPLNLALKTVKKEIQKKTENPKTEYLFVWRYVAENFENILQ